MPWRTSRTWVWVGRKSTCLRAVKTAWSLVRRTLDFWQVCATTSVRKKSATTTRPRLHPSLTGALMSSSRRLIASLGSRAELVAEAGAQDDEQDDDDADDREADHDH